MGLDNIPLEAPCQKAGTAVVVPNINSPGSPDQINCDLTQDEGGCPYVKSHLFGMPGAVYGIMGAACWYRGKVAGFAVDTLLESGSELPEGLENHWYGTDAEDGLPELSPDYCQALAEWMSERAELYLHLVALTDDDPENLKAAGETYQYAVQWLRWVAEAGDGALAWY